MKLTSSQWELLAPLVTPLVSSSLGSFATPRGRGRPSQDARAVLEAVFWVMRTGAPWADLPPRYPPYQTCHRRFRGWLENGILAECLRRLADDLDTASGSGAGASLHAAHTWRENTAALLASPLARQALTAPGRATRPALTVGQDPVQ